MSPRVPSATSAMRMRRPALPRPGTSNAARAGLSRGPARPPASEAGGDALERPGGGDAADRVGGDARRERGPAHGRAPAERGERQRAGDEEQLPELDAEVEEEQRQRDRVLGEPDRAQRAGEAE